jgi:hypothetical protein
MKRICILCEDSVIEQARERAKSFLHVDVLKIPLSKNGKLPATHWFCHLQSTDEGYEKFLQMQQYTIIEESGPREFLNRCKLKIIR